MILWQEETVLSTRREQAVVISQPLIRVGASVGVLGSCRSSSDSPVRTGLCFRALLLAYPGTMSSSTSGSSSDSGQSTSVSNYPRKRQRLSEDEHDSDSQSESHDSDSSSDSGSDAEEEEEPVLSHAERRRQKKKEERVAKKSAALANGDTSKKGKEKVQNTAELPPSKVPKRQHSVWVGNLSFKTTPASLRSFFEGVGEITRIHMPMKMAHGGPDGKPRKENRGSVLTYLSDCVVIPNNILLRYSFAYVDFATPDAKTIAITMSENPLEGRRLLIKDGTYS